MPASRSSSRLVAAEGEAFRLAAETVDTELLVFLSTDGNEDPGDLPEILSRLRAGADLVVAGRFVRRGARTDTSDDPLRLRKAGAITFGLLARLLWRTGCWDATNGYRGFRVDALRRLALDASGHDIEYQSTIRAAKLKMRRVEIPTRELRRLGGERKVTAGTWALGSSTLRCLVRELRIGRDFQPAGPVAEAAARGPTLAKSLLRVRLLPGICTVWPGDPTIAPARKLGRKS